MTTTNSSLSKTLDLMPLAPSDLHQVPAQYQMALLRPRRWDTITTKLLSACESVDFAREAYTKKPGSHTVQLSLRFVELAQQLMGNLSVECVPEMLDAAMESYRMIVIDLESNSQASEVFRVKPDHPERLRTQMAQAKRALVGALVPSELRTACLERCRQVVAKEDGKDPVAASKPLTAALGELGLPPSDLKELLGKALSSVTAKDVETLRGAYLLLRDGDLTLQEITGKAQMVQAPLTPPAKPPKAKRQTKSKPKLPRAGAETPPVEPPKSRASLRGDDDDDPPAITTGASSNAAPS